MGEICIRFKKMDEIPLELIEELMQKRTPQDYWIVKYESVLKR